MEKKHALVMAIIVLKIVIIEPVDNLYGQLAEGNKIEFWSPTYIDYEPLLNEKQYIINAVIEKTGKHCCILFEEGDTLPSQHLIDTLVQIFDNIYYPELTTAFGPVPFEFVNDSMVYVIFLNDPEWGGFFDPGQLMPDTFIYNNYKKHSTEKNIIYVNSVILEYETKYFSVVAHELTHMLTWNYDHSPEPIENPVMYWEDSWINEAWSGLATSYFNYDFVLFGPDIKYTNYSELSFNTSYMNEPLLFIYYLLDNYGGWDFIKTLLNNQLNGMDGVENTLNNLGYNKSFDDLFTDFTIANYVNDTIYADGIYSYKSINLISCFNSTETKCARAKYGLYEGELAFYAKEYFYFDLQEENPLPIEFQGDENSKFRLVFILANKDKEIMEIKTIIPDNTNSAVFSKDSIIEGCDILIMAIINIDRSLNDNELVSFTYKTPEPITLANNSQIKNVLIYPNPVSQNITIKNIMNNNPACFELFNLQGRKILSKTILKDENINLQHLIKGIYLYNVITNHGIQSGKLIKE
ncbi:MAG: T9SS type A sorting domain-containing protein [Bacteroidales bacterium]|nr:T9SS type A sorting domain-containing protein [Bacteroidales bacterium]